MSHRVRLTERLAELPFLLAERRYNQKELMTHFDVDRKTIKQDIDALSSRHPIYEEKEGRHVYYRLEEKFKPPALTPVELAALMLAQEAIGTTGPAALSSPFARHARSLLAKVRNALPATLHEKLDAMAAVFGSATAPAKDFAPFAEIIERLVDAAVERRSVWIRYYTLHSGKTKERKLDPYAVYFDPDGATLKVIGYDHERKDKIPFSIDHIRRLRETNERFERPVGFDLREFLAINCFNGIHGEPISVRLRAHGITACIFAERTFHRTQREIDRTPIGAERPETVTIEMEVAEGRGLERFILSWTPDIEVLSPPELRRRIAELHKQSLSRHEED